MRNTDHCREKHRPEKERTKHFLFLGDAKPCDTQQPKHHWYPVEVSTAALSDNEKVIKTKRKKKAF